MKKITYLFCSLYVMAAMIACSNEEPQQPAAQQTYTMTIQASKCAEADSAASSSVLRVLSLDGNTLNASWAEGEAVTVYNITRSADLSGKLTAQSSGTSTTLKGTLTGTIEAGDELLLKFRSPSYSFQEGTLSYIAKNCDYAEATTTVSAVANGRITASDASFTNQQAIVKFTLLNKANNANLSASAFSIEIDGYIYAVVPLITTTTGFFNTTTTVSPTDVFYVALPAISNKKVSLFAKTSDGWYSYAKTGVTFAQGQYYTISAKLEQTGTLPGVFTFGSGVTKRFSQGNLKYNGSTWSFHTEQYDHLESYSNSNYDLFYWETAGNYGSASSYQTTSGGSPNDRVDWGTRVITNGGNVANAYSTPSLAEWTYLFNTRADADSKRGTANINEVHGLVILPDHWTLPGRLSFNTEMATWDSHLYNNKTNKYTVTDWTMMEAAGAVFLPAAGMRQSGVTNPEYYGRYGYYWSSTARDESNAYEVYFAVGAVSPIYTDYRHNGKSVRLVKNAE